MTALGQFDQFEQRIVDAIDELAAPRRPDYLADVFAVTARTSQRPRWAFPGRWLPALDTTGVAARTPTRPLLLVAVAALLALAAAAILIAGARPKVPLPVGPARNGALVYPVKGDLVRLDSLTGSPTPLVVSPTKEYSPYISPDGRTIAFARVGDGGDYLWAVDIDGANPRQLMTDPLGTGWSQWSWSLDSTHLLLTGDIRGTRRLFDVAADGSGAREVVLDKLVPWDAFWSPVDPDTFLLRAQKTTGLNAVDLYLASADGARLRPLGLPGQSAFGPQWTLSGPTWSPDGKTIAYNAIVLEPRGLQTLYRVHVVNTDGTGDRELPAPDGPKVNQGWPTFSPDGTQLLVQRWVFPSDTGATNASGWIGLLPADGSSVGRDIGFKLENSNDPDVSKFWSPSGTQVIEWVDAGARTFLVDPATGSFEPFTGPSDIGDWQRLAP